MGTGIVDIRDAVPVPTDRHTAGPLDRLHALIALTQHGAKRAADQATRFAPTCVWRRLHGDRTCRLSDRTVPSAYAPGTAVTKIEVLAGRSPQRA